MGSGLELSRRFYTEVVGPVWARTASTIPHAAGLIGRGSEVLGYDDVMSTDHNWAARVLIVIDDDTGSDRAGDPGRLERELGERLPERFEGVATEIDVHTLSGWLDRELALDPRQTWDAADWLSLSEQRLCATTAGAVFHDRVGLTAVRDRLGYYPRDVWLYLLSCGWWRIHPELNLVGRSGSVGDDLGSRLIAADLVDALMRLCFLIERRYAPYRKWFGTAFARLSIADRLGPVLRAVLTADDTAARERSLATAYTVVAEAFAALGLVPPLELATVRMWDRPFGVPWADFPASLTAAISDPQVRRIADRWPTGFVDGVRELLWTARDRGSVRDLLRGSG